MTGSRPILVLAGTEEGRACCARLQDRTPAPVVASLAGGTHHPARYSVPVRTGGFGGWSGLADYLQAESIALVVDATHPFAVQISRNARKACKRAGIPLTVLQRPPWQPRPGDTWHMCTSLEEALCALPSGARVLVALGRKQLATLINANGPVRHNIRWIVRTIDPVMLPSHANLDLVTGRPPFTAAQERALIRHHAITAILCRNSGGRSGRAKLDAAAALGLPVYMIDRPGDELYAQDIPCHQHIDDMLAWIEALMS